jgi:hypothetical protein
VFLSQYGQTAARKRFFAFWLKRRKTPIFATNRSAIYLFLTIGPQAKMSGHPCFRVHGPSHGRISNISFQ